MMVKSHGLARAFTGRIKQYDDIEGIRRAGALTAEILDKLTDFIHIGVTTKEIDAFVYAYCKDHNARPATLNYKGFPSSCCTSFNDVVCHGIPDDTEVKDGDILNVDVTTIVNGYFGDSCRMYTAGTVSDKAKKLVNDAYHCLQLGISQVKPGNTTGDIGYAIQHYAESKGYSVVRDYGGHGVGFEFHEEPHIHHFGVPGTGVILEPGMVFTIEPMINLGRHDCKVMKDGWTVKTKDGSLSAQWEHTIAVTPDGVDILTLSQ